MDNSDINSWVQNYFKKYGTIKVIVVVDLSTKSIILQQSRNGTNYSFDFPIQEIDNLTNRNVVENSTIMTYVNLLCSLALPFANMNSHITHTSCVENDDIHRSKLDDRYDAMNKTIQHSEDWGVLKLRTQSWYIDAYRTSRCKNTSELEHSLGEFNIPKETFSNWIIIMFSSLHP